VNIGTTTPNVPKISTSIVTMPSEPFKPAAVTGSTNITTAVPPPAVLPLPASSSGELSEAESYDNAYDNTSESVSSSFPEKEAGEIDQSDFIYQNFMFARGAKTTMIISVKKQSVLDLKTGKINFDEFVKRAEITQY
jgi:hypothetical protein